MDILDKLKEAYEMCEDLKAKAKAGVDKYNLLVSEVEAEKAKVADETARLTGIECRLAHVVDVDKHMNESVAMRNQAEESLKSINLRVANFTQYEDAMKKELIVKESLLNKREKAIGEREANLESTILAKVQSILKKG